MTEVAGLLLKAVLQYGAIGLLALIGWALAGALLYREYKRKESVSELVDQKDKEINDTKDKMAEKIEDLSDKRILDLKEITEDYNRLAQDVAATMDRLTLALEIKHEYRKKD